MRKVRIKEIYYLCTEMFALLIKPFPVRLYIMYKRSTRVQAFSPFLYNVAWHVMCGVPDREQFFQYEFVRSRVKMIYGVVVF